MSQKFYSLSKDGDTKLSANFTVWKFRCKDGGDTVLIDTELVELLQEIRKACKLSQEQVAAKLQLMGLNIGQKAVSRMETGQSSYYGHRRTAARAARRG